MRGCNDAAAAFESLCGMSEKRYYDPQLPARPERNPGEISAVRGALAVIAALIIPLVGLIIALVWLFQSKLGPGFAVLVASGVGVIFNLLLYL